MQKVREQKIIFNQADKKFIDEYNAYAVVLPAGSSGIKPKSIKSIDKKNCILVSDVLNGNVDIENRYSTCRREVLQDLKHQLN